MTLRRLYPALALAAIALAPACNRNRATETSVSTEPVTRRDIIIDAQANGVVEPINVVEVKSKASGMITRMPVETGTNVRPGALIAQVDQRDVQNQYNQAEADLRAAEARLQVSVAQKRRSDEMFRQRVITAQEHETSALDYANAEAAVVRARANLDLAKQRLEDATVTAPVAGTVIEKTVSLGMVITSATGAFGGGTTLIKMADLTRVRMRAQFNETDIGQIRAGQPAIVVVDAYPDRRFQGLVEKIEPQAVVQQGVTMFPVLVTLSNLDNALKPGMNGEVQVQIDQRIGVLAVPNDAVRNVREAAALAPLLGLDPDSVQAQVRAQFGAGRGGMRVGTQGVQGGAPRVTASPGEVELQQSREGFQAPQVSERDCAAVTAAMQKKPDEARKLDALRARMRAGDIDRQAMRAESQRIYQALGVDPRVAGACARQARGGEAPAAAEPQRGTARPAATRPADAARQAAPPQLQIGDAERARGRNVRSGLVFVARGTTFEPRMVLLGSGNFDYTEVISGLQEGDEVALLAATSLQAQRQQQTDRIRRNMGGGVPGMTQGGTRPGGAAPRGGR